MSRRTFKAEKYGGAQPMGLTIVRGGLTYANCWNGRVRLSINCSRAADRAFPEFNVT
jgi:hypothetical protein